MLADTLSLFPEQNRERATGVMDAVGSTMGVRIC
mgnify:CR=1 FL=1